MSEQLKRITRAQVKPVTMMLLDRQKWICPLCGKKISPDVVGHRSDYVLDHNHETGEIRGALHRSCNSAEGKTLKAVGSWGAKSMKYEAVIPYLRNLLAYYERKGTGMMYPDHKTPEQQRVIRLKKQRESAARSRAKKAMQKGAK